MGWGDHLVMALLMQGIAHPAMRVRFLIGSGVWGGEIIW
jgi:hypothetical protein